MRELHPPRVQRLPRKRLARLADPGVPNPLPSRLPVDRVADERVAGKGVGREAERLTNKKAYEEFGAHKVYGRIPATNEAAKKAVIYNGWKQEGILRRHVRHGDDLVDVELWGGFPEDQPDAPADEVEDASN